MLYEYLASDNHRVGENRCYLEMSALSVGAISDVLEGRDGCRWRLSDDKTGHNDYDHRCNLPSTSLGSLKICNLTFRRPEVNIGWKW